MYFVTSRKLLLDFVSSLSKYYVIWRERMHSVAKNKCIDFVEIRVIVPSGFPQGYNIIWYSSSMFPDISPPLSATVHFKLRADCQIQKKWSRGLSLSRRRWGDGLQNQSLAVFCLPGCVNRGNFIAASLNCKQWGSHPLPQQLLCQVAQQLSHSR